MLVCSLFANSQNCMKNHFNSIEISNFYECLDHDQSTTLKAKVFRQQSKNNCIGRRDCQYSSSESRMASTYCLFPCKLTCYFFTCHFLYYHNTHTHTVVLAILLLLFSLFVHEKFTYSIPLNAVISSPFFYILFKNKETILTRTHHTLSCLFLSFGQFNRMCMIMKFYFPPRCFVCVWVCLFFIS